MARAHVNTRKARKARKARAHLTVNFFWRVPAKKPLIAKAR
jgi:hypothetical protein